MKNYDLKLKPQIISFDAADTLIKLARSIGEHYSHAAAKYGVEVQAEQINKCFLKVFHSTPPLDEGGSKGLTWWKDVIERSFREVGFERKHFTDFEAFASELYEALAEESVWLAYPDAEATLKLLHENNFRLIVFSNFDERLIKILTDLKLLNYFERVICSSQIGYAKPDKNAFLQVAHLMGVSPDKMLHVGDGFENDYLGALRAGFQALFLNRHKLNTYQMQYSEDEIESLFAVPLKLQIPHSKLQNS